MLDEMALRLPDFRGDVGVVLSDGQTWFLPKPVVEFRLTFDLDGEVGFKKRLIGLGADYLAVVDRFWEAEGVSRLIAGADLVCTLLRENYGIDNDDLTDLLPWRPDDEANQAMWKELIDVAEGAPVPKDVPVSGGSDSP